MTSTHRREPGLLTYRHRKRILHGILLFIHHLDHPFNMTHPARRRLPSSCNMYMTCASVYKSVTCHTSGRKWGASATLSGSQRCLRLCLVQGILHVNHLPLFCLHMSWHCQQSPQAASVLGNTYHFDIIVASCCT